MPGANQQFQYWFIPFVPLFVGMIGLPGVLTFWVPLYFYPFLNGDPAPQHYMLLNVSGWLLTVGPQDDLFKFLLNAVMCPIKWLKGVGKTAESDEKQKEA